MHRVEPVVVLPVKVSKLLEEFGRFHARIVTKIDYFMYSLIVMCGLGERGTLWLNCHLIHGRFSVRSRQIFICFISEKLIQSFAPSVSYERRWGMAT